MGKHINKANSIILTHLHQKHGGKWADLMADPVVKQMGYDRYRIESHLAYKRRAVGKEKLGVKKEPTSNSSQSSDADEVARPVAILEKKTTETDLLWRVVFSDGEASWEHESFFTDLDGIINPLFVAFETQCVATTTTTTTKKRDRSEETPVGDDESVKIRKTETLRLKLRQLQDQVFLMQTNCTELHIQLVHLMDTL